jgi:TonB-dependent receptor
MDSIVAEDVGSLPDRNIGEAISRMSGIALDRGDFGEGVSVAVRGNGPDLTRVEIDGQGVQSAGGTDMNGGGSGRGTEFRQLSADLIKSVDVVKGSTADMTEGSLGGGIIIKTRTGLDFKKPFASVRVAASRTR